MRKSLHLYVLFRYDLSKLWTPDVGKQYTDTTFDQLVDDTLPRDQKDAIYQRSRLKTSLHMGELLKRYDAHLRNSITFPPEGWTFPHTGPLDLQPHLEAKELSDTVARYADRPLHKQRELFLERLQGSSDNEGLIETAYKQALNRAVDTQSAEIRLLEAEIMQLQGDLERLLGVVATLRSSRTPLGDRTRIIAQLQQGVAGLRSLIALKEQELSQSRARVQSVRDRAWDPDSRADSRKRIVQRLRTHVQQMVDRYWPSFDLIPGYRQLLASRELLDTLGADIFTAEERKLLFEPYKRYDTAQPTIEHNDVPALHYLSLLVHGTDGSRYDHIVVDEAQDVSELEFLTMRQFFSSQTAPSFTILGDLSQSLYSHRGISSWDQLQQVFRGTPYVYRELQQSYRTTYEIMQSASTVIQALNADGAMLPVPIPFERHGSTPQLIATENQDIHIRKVADALARSLQQGHKNIAIVAKTRERCQQIDRQLTLVNRSTSMHRLILSADVPYTGGVVILPAYVTKGLEFDAVIIADADNQSYSQGILDGRLLYIAMTRPLHDLTILWTGKPSPHLARVVRR